MPQETPRVRMVCYVCGSENVLRDAYASWNVETQEWELQNVFDAAVCEGRCEGETKIEEVPVDDQQEASSPDDVDGVRSPD